MSEDFAITSEVPAPVTIRKYASKYPFAAMAKGSSFRFVGKALCQKVRNSAYQWKRTANKKTGAQPGDEAYVNFVIQPTGETENGEPVYRLWKQ